MPIMSDFLPLSTDRLTLRPLTMADENALYAFLSLPEVARYQLWEPMDRETVREKLKEWMTLNGRAGRHLELGVVLDATGELIGHVILAFRNPEARQGEIGFTFHPAFQRQGYAFEAVRALMDIGFRHYRLHRIFGITDVRNTASFRLMEKLGMRREAHFREHAIFKGGWDEEYHYAMLESEWRALNGDEA